MFDPKLIKYALATVIAAAGVFSLNAYADGFAAAEPADSAAPAPEDTTAPAPYTPPRYFNPYTPHQDNPTNPPGTWVVYPSPTGNDLYCVDFVDVNNGWAGGRSVALRYRNGTWSVIPGHSGHVFRGIEMLSINDGWAVGWDGNKEKPAIWRWDGSDWKEFQNPTGAVYCIDMINTAKGWIGGNGYFLRYNGTSWEYGGVAADSVLGIHMFSDNEGRATCFHKILRKLGSNWVEEAHNDTWNLASIFMVNLSKGWATGQSLTGEKGMLLEYAGTWREYKIYDKARSIARLDIQGSDFGWAVGWRNPNRPYGSFLLFYNGREWLEISTTWDNALTGIRIINKDDGWIVGYRGLILKYKPNVSVKETSLGKIKAKYR